MYLPEKRKKIRSTGKDMHQKKVREDMRKKRKTKHKQFRLNASVFRPDAHQKVQAARQIRLDAGIGRPDAIQRFQRKNGTRVIRPDEITRRPIVWEQLTMAISLQAPMIKCSSLQHQVSSTMREAYNWERDLGNSLLIQILRGKITTRGRREIKKLRSSKMKKMAAVHNYHMPTFLEGVIRAYLPYM
ncbi:hypothetical protein M0R45_025931 [Rubus argutus]|uniref:Uncharacterized protein n=1 Tax=Rubus argutus TaxID=59490 RepID=A0AAW1WYF5_RUBAR